MPFSKNNNRKEILFVNKWLNEFPNNISSLNDNICPNTGIGNINVDGLKITVDCLSNNPIICRLNNLLSPQECDHFIKITKDRFARSLAETSDSATSSIRTSLSALLNRSEDEVVKKLEERISKLLKIDSRQIEPLQVVKYTPGLKYDFHTDWFDKSLPYEAKHVTKKMGGQRVYTILILS